MEREMTNWIDNIWPKFLDAGLSIGMGSDSPDYWH